MASVLIAEDLLLLLLDAETGKAAKRQELPAALGGALLVELALEGLVEIEPKQGMFGSAKVHVEDARRPDDALLASALDLVQERPQSAKQLVERLGKGAKETLAERLVGRGILERREGHALGLFPRTTWPTRDATHEQQVRRAVADAITGSASDQRTIALIALLSAIDYVQRAVDVPGTSPSEVRKRAKRLADGDWAAKAVKDSVQAAHAATMAAVAATSGGATG